MGDIFGTAQTANQGYNTIGRARGISRQASANRNLEVNSSTDNVLPPIERNRSSQQLQNTADYTRSIDKLQNKLLSQQKPRFVGDTSQQSTNLEDSYGNDGGSSNPGVSRHSVQQQVIDMNTKVRQLEIGIMDVQAASERKLKSILDEIPAKFMRDIHNLEQKEAVLHKEQKGNMTFALEELEKLKNSHAGLLIQVKDKFQQLELTSNESKYKTDSLAKHI